MGDASDSDVDTSVTRFDDESICGCSRFVDCPWHRSPTNFQVYLLDGCQRLRIENAALVFVDFGTEEVFEGAAFQF